MKTTLNDGKLWGREGEGRLWELGLTEEHYNATGTVWVFVPRAVKAVKAGDIIAHYESQKGLGALRAPFTCGIVKWNTTLLETPERITPESVLLTVKA